jgi:hypothetical protein
VNVGKEVCVIGAQGALGGIVLDGFRARGWTALPAGRRADRREGFRHVDLRRPETLESALEGVDLVISTVADPGLAAERWVLEHGGTLVNCSHASGAAAQTLEAEAGPAKGTILLNAGLVPGVANLAASALLTSHPQADCLEVAFTVLKEGTAGRGGADFIHAGLVSRSHHRVRTLSLPEPFGRQTCIEIHEDEDCGFAGVAGGREVRNYLGFADWSASWSLRAVNAMRLMRLLPRAAFATGAASPGSASREPTAIWLGAKRGNEGIGASVLECEGDYRTTAEAARVFGEALLARGRPGCFNPEDLFDFGELAAPLTEIGVRVARGR